MWFLPGLAVVFAGIAGQSDHRVERQLHAIARELHLATARLTATELATIGHHGEGARAIVARLHSDGVIAGEYVTSGGHAMVRLFIYNGDGGMRSLAEMPLTGSVLGADELSTIRANLEDELVAMTPAIAPVAPVAAAAPVAPVPTAAPTAPVTRPRRPVAAPAPATDSTPDPAPESAPGSGATPAPAGDSVSVADLEALTAGAPDDATHIDASATAAPSTAELHLRAALGFGLATRSFTPGPTTVPAYTSSAVGIVRFAAAIQPTTKLELGGSVERSLGMTTPEGTAAVATEFSRWELTADYALVHGAVEVRPLLGVGHRAFAIDSTAASSSPACAYSYAMLGARASAAVGSRVAVLGHVVFDPVLGGTDPMQMELGAATRWALDVGAAVEVRPTAHVFARAAIDYQRFSWAWDQAGARGAGGAVDSYPSGTVSVGADY